MGDVPRDIPIGGGDILGASGRDTGRDYPVTGWIYQGENQRLDGYEALWFARSRQGSDNNERMDRQRCLISAAVDQFDVAKLARAFPALAASAERNIQTDITAKQLPAFIELGQRVKAAPLRSLSLTSANIDTADPDYAQVRSLVLQALVPPEPAPAATAPSATASPSAAPSASADPSEDAEGAASPTTPTTPTTPPGQAVDAAQSCG